MPGHEVGWNSMHKVDHGFHMSGLLRDRCAWVELNLNLIMHLLWYSPPPILLLSFFPIPKLDNIFCQTQRDILIKVFKGSM